MGDSLKAAYESERNLANAMDQVGLLGDKKWGYINSSRFVTTVEERVVLECAAAGKSTYDTIRSLHRELAIHRARQEAKAEINERESLKKLTEKY